MSTLRLYWRLFLFGIICFLITVTQWPCLRITRGPSSYIMPRLWQAAVCKIFGIKVYVHGTPYNAKQTLYIGNHISYLDIPALGSVIKGTFVAKKELAQWPLFGFLSTLQQTAFISRDRQHARQEKENLEKMIREGKNMILFAEGTSTDGTQVLPFKSSLFALVYNPDGSALDLMIQPVTITVRSVDGQIVETGPGPVRDKYAWHGDMTLEPHIAQFARGRGAEIDIIFHPPRNPADYNGDRKALARDCHDDVASGMNKLVRAAAA